MNDLSQPDETPAIPDHQLIRLIGKGSYGEVWLARNVIGTYRAVKIVYRKTFPEARPYAREFEGIKKFEPISRSHPGLVDILQVGRNEGAGYFYYVMELADDEASDRVFDPALYSAKTLGKELSRRGRLPAAESLELGRSLAAGLAHMHGRGLIHRDIKPSNIIFVNGEPKLADIGLVVEVTDATRSGVGTAGYMPPEGHGTIPADIYSLGKVLYEISTGQDRTLFPELPVDLAQFPDAELVVELNEVVVKACANIPAGRYAEAGQLREDLDFLIAGRSVKRLRFLERQVKRAKRFAVAASILAVAAIAVGSKINQMRQRQKELLADSYLTAGARLVEDHNYHGALPFFAEAARLQSHDPAALATHRARVGTLLQQSPQLLQFFQTEGVLSDVRFAPDGERLLVAGGRRAWLTNIETGAGGPVFETEHSIETAAFSPDGRRIALANGDLLTLADAVTGESVSHRMPGHVYSAEFSADGKTILVACGDFAAHLVDALSGELEGSFVGHTESVQYAAFSVDGLFVVTASRDGTARIWSTASRQLIQTLPHGDTWVFEAAFSPDGRHVVTGSADHTVRLWNTNGSAIGGLMEHRAGVRRVRFSPDGHCILSAGFDQKVCFWDAESRKPAEASLNLHAAAMQAAFDGDARRVAAVGVSGEITVWRITPEAPVNVGAGVVSGDGERYVTFKSNSFQVYNTSDDSPATLEQPVGEKILAVLCSRNAQRIVVQTPGPERRAQTVHVFDANGHLIVSFSTPVSGRYWWLNADGTKLITGTRTNLYLWDTQRGTPLFDPAGLPVKIEKVAFSPDNRVLAVTGSGSASVFLLDANNGQPLASSPLQHERRVGTMAFAPDSKRIVTGTSTDGFSPCAAQLWDVWTGGRVGAPIAHADGIGNARFSHDGKLLATSGEDQRVMIWDSATGRARTEPISLLWTAHSLEFSGDDRWLLTATWYETTVWDVRTGHAVTPTFGDPALFSTAGFCGGSKRVWVQSSSGLLFWNLPRDNTEPDELIAFADRLGVPISPNVRWNPATFPPEHWRARCAAERQQTRASLGAWQREQAALSERKRDWFAAQFHLERLLKASPDDAALRERLEKARARLKATSAVVTSAQTP